jgi:hypothetical protein
VQLGSERSDKRRLKPAHTGRARRIWFGMIAVGFLVGFGAFVVDLVPKVRRGEVGAIVESLRSHGPTYVGVLVILALAPVVLIVGGAIAWWRGREERDFEAKFRKRPPQG